nr:Chain P, 9-meric peptide from Tegument protein pp65 [Human betaherpesvirus 5]
NLVPMCATV